MDKQLCFVINEHRLFTDKVLVYFNEIPLFFVCCSENKEYYLALCTDIINYDYLVFKVSRKNLWLMLQKRISMRKTILCSDCFWRIVSGDDYTSDQVEQMDISQIDLSVLPYEDALFEPQDDDLEYIRRIDSEYFNGLRFSISKPIKESFETEELSACYFNNSAYGSPLESELEIWCNATSQRASFSIDPSSFPKYSSTFNGLLNTIVQHFDSDHSNTVSRDLFFNDAA